MALNSSTVSSGDLATAQQYNDLRSDVVSTSSGHVHDGTLGVGSAQFILNVAGVPLLLQNTTDAASNEALRIAGGNRGTAADNDEVTIDGYLDNCGETQTLFGSITLKALDNGPSCTYDSRWEFQQYTAGTLREVVVPAVTADDTLAVLGLAQTFSAAKTFSGGLTVSGGTIDYDGTCVDFLSSGDIDLVSSRDAAAAIYIAQSTGTSGTIKIHADTGTSVTEGAESINIVSDAGGVGIRSTANLANAINITADGSTASTIQIYNDSGTAVNEGVASIQLLSDGGGIGIKSGLDAAGAIRLTADAGACETIILHSDQGTGEGSITLTSDAGGIDLNAAAGKDIALDSGQVLITATHNTACTIYLHANGGTAETIKIHSDQGTSESSITILSDAGGINIDAPAAKDIDIAGGTINLTSSDNAGSAIYLRANAGTSETIKIHADQGNGVGSICLTSDVGGITLNPATFVTVGGNSTNAGEIRMFEDTDNGCNYVAIKPGNVSTSYTMTLPTAVAGTCGFVLTSTTAGVTSWAAAASGCVVCDTSPQLGANLDAQNYNLLNVGAATNDWTATGITHVGTGDMKLTITSCGTTGHYGIMHLYHVTGANMADTFGVQMHFHVEDVNSGDKDLGHLWVERHGADNTGRLGIDLNNGGSFNSPALLLTAPGVLSVDLAGSGSAAQVDLFDDYCDPVEIERYAHTMGTLVTPEQQEINRQRMLEMGIIDKKDSGSGYMLNLQPLTRLLAGGIYQNAARITALEAKLEAQNG
jgi:autotransporter-associated beta strand protein